MEMTEGLTQAERSVLEPPYHPRLDRPSLQVGISHFHIPPTDCPYKTDIYFFYNQHDGTILVQSRADFKKEHDAKVFGSKYF